MGVPPFPSHAREAKPAERRDRSQSTTGLVFDRESYFDKANYACNKNDEEKLLGEEQTAPRS